MKATITVNGDDPRVERTRAALFWSLLDLIVEQGYERTTVADILRRADVGRATFYAHYYNKEDLLLGRMSAFQFAPPPPGADGRIAAPDLRPVFAHAGEFRELYESLRGDAILERALATARHDLTASFERWLTGIAAERRGPLEAQALAQCLAAALLQLLTWWLDSGARESPATMNAWFARLVEGALPGGAPGAAKQVEPG